MSEYYLIAEIKAAFGNEGFVSLFSHSDKQERFFEIKNVFIDVFGVKKEFFFEEVIFKKDLCLVKFRNFNTDKSVDFLIGKKIFVDQENLVKLETDEFFVHDLIGSRVMRNNLYYGQIVDVLILPANNVIVINNQKGEEEMLPLIFDYFESFDAKNKVLTLKPGGDLYDTDED